MPKILLPIILIWFIFPCVAQVSHKVNAELGTVQILLPPVSFAGEKADDYAYAEQIVKIYLKSKSSAQEMSYKGKGLFELAVQQGIYQIVLRDMKNSSTPYKRANFFVPSNKITKIIISPVEAMQRYEVCSQSEGFIIDARPSEFDVEATNAFYKDKRNNRTKPLYDKFQATKRYNLVIKYCRRNIKKQSISYKFARLTYQDITIEADRIIFDRKNSLIEASGNKDAKVWVENQDCGEEKQTLKLNLSKLAQLTVNCQQSQK